MSDDIYKYAYGYMYGHPYAQTTTTAALPGDPNIVDTAPSELSPDPIETEEEKRDRLWAAVVSASQGNG